MSKMTLEAFIKHYRGAPLDDEAYASVIVSKLPEDLPVVKAAHGYLEAHRVFGLALEIAGIERG